VTASGETEEIRLVLGQINDAWLKGRSQDIPRALDPCLAEDVVVWGPDFREVARGKDACVKSYVEFVTQAVVKHCTLSEPDIHRVGGTAVASYSWEMTYTLNVQEYRESGHDVFVLDRSEGQWRVIWRMIVPSQVRPQQAEHVVPPRI
jgi:hypothetical protein